MTQRTTTIRAALEAHATVCRQEAVDGREQPQWTGGSLAGARLTKAALFCANLTKADLRGADLSGADLRWTILTGANLSGAILAGADLASADLRDADLTGADLLGADLTLAALSGADLSGARLTEGVARGRAIGKDAGSRCWWAVGLESGDPVIQYNQRRHPLRWWLTEGHRFYSLEYWEHGPAVAIAAAQALAVGGAA